MGVGSRRSKTITESRVMDAFAVDRVLIIGDGDLASNGFGALRCAA